MANELNLSLALTFSKGNASTTRSSGTSAITVSGSAFQQGVQNIGTAEEVVSLGDVALGGYIMLHNCDATNYVELGLTGDYVLKLKAGEWAMFRWSGGALTAKANTSAINLEKIIIAD